MGPLHGLRVVVTRALHQAEELASPLRELGAEVLLLPMLSIGPPLDSQPLTQAAAHCDSYDWIVFTSANAVQAFLAAGPAQSPPARAKIATVGDATRQACELQGWTVHLTPSKFVAEALVESFSAYGLKNRRVLIPAAAVTRDVLPVELRKRGALVDVVEAYRNVRPPDAPQQVERVLRDPYPDWVLFASSSAVQNLVDLAGAARVNRMRVATIGSITTATARGLGVNVTSEAPNANSEGLVQAILTKPLS